MIQRTSRNRDIIRHRLARVTGNAIVVVVNPCAQIGGNAAGIGDHDAEGRHRARRKRRDRDPIFVIRPGNIISRGRQIGGRGILGIHQLPQTQTAIGGSPCRRETAEITKIRCGRDDDYRIVLHFTGSAQPGRAGSGGAGETEPHAELGTCPRGGGHGEGKVLRAIDGVVGNGGIIGQLLSGVSEKPIVIVVDPHVQVGW